MNGRWILLGDFYIMLAQEERLSKVSYDQNEIDAFVDCCERNDLQDASIACLFFGT